MNDLRASPGCQWYWVATMMPPMKSHSTHHGRCLLEAMKVPMVWMLSLAVRTLPLGTAYAVWTGIGAVGTVIFGIVRFGESASPFRLACVGLIIAGLVGLKFAPGSK